MRDRLRVLAEERGTSLTELLAKIGGRELTAVEREQRSLEAAGELGIEYSEQRPSGRPGCLGEDPSSPGWRCSKAVARLTYWPCPDAQPDGRRSFSWKGYRDLIQSAHHWLGDPIVLVWDNCETRGHSPGEVRPRGTTGRGCLVQDLSACDPGRYLLPPDRWMWPDSGLAAQDTVTVLTVHRPDVGHSPCRSSCRVNITGLPQPTLPAQSVDTRASLGCGAPAARRAADRRVGRRYGLRLREPLVLRTPARSSP